MECRAVEVIGALERREAWHADEIITGPIACFTKALSDGRAGACHKLINRDVTLVVVARPDVDWRHDTRGKAFTLVNVENYVFAKHRYYASSGFLSVFLSFLVADRELLHEIHAHAMLALANMIAQLQCL